MGRFAYYSPLLVGATLVLLLNDAIRAERLAVYSPAVQWSIIAGLAAAFAVHCQVLMIGAQGAFAQVLPVPGGRSIRGPGAVAAGWLLVLWCVLGLVAAVLLYDGRLFVGGIVGGTAVGVLLMGLLLYAWNLPAAVRDFAVERGGL